MMAVSAIAQLTSVAAALAGVRMPIVSAVASPDRCSIAVDACHRVGDDRSVRVYSLLAAFVDESREQA